MTDVLGLVVRSSAILAAALLADGVLRRRSAALRHAVAAGALFAAAAVGPLGSVLPTWTLTVPGARSASVVDEATRLPSATPMPWVAGDTGSTAAETRAIRWPTRRLVVSAWLAGVIVFLLRLLLAYRRLHRIAGRARPLTDAAWTSQAARAADAAGVGRRVMLLETDLRDVLATWGIARPRILVPAHARDWPRDRLQAVLYHEMAHVARCDWLVQAVADVVLAVYWFNPLAWLAARRLRLESERACDDAVLRRGVAACEYAAHLVEIARACRAMPTSATAALPMARYPDLHTRITTMLNASSPVPALSRRAVALVALTLVAVAAPLSALRLAPDEPRPVSGVVYDSTGAVVPGARVTLDDERQARVEAVSDAAGRFALPPVGPGRYMLGAAVPGFRALKQPIELRREGDWERAITLQLGGVQETITVRSARLPAPQPAATPARVRVGGKISPPRKLRDAHPVYPESMRVAGIEGKVDFEAIIGRDGTVQSARVVSGLVHPDLAQAAVDAVRQWRFEPTTLNGTPVEVVMNVAMTFELEK